MKKGIVLGMVILVIGVGFTGSTYSLSISESQKFSFDGNILYVGGNGSGNYTRIQDAIDNASDGDTVFVYDDSAPYWESIVVDKSIKLIGEDRNTTRISSMDNSTVSLRAPNITLTEFKITDCNMVNRGGVNIQSSFNNVHHNVITNNGCGIYINGYGEEYNSNQIHHNIITCSDDFADILLIYTSYNEIYENIISESFWGIALERATNNSIYRNKILNNGGGIEVWYSSYNSIFDNYITRNSGCCIIIYFYSTQNIVYRNQLVNNTRYGIKLDSNDNFIYHNNFINNSKGHATDKGNNTWDDGKYGNYWSDYEERYPDAKPKLFKPWMWDTPYVIPGGNNTDNCPLVKEWPNSVSIDRPRIKVNYNSLFLRFLERFPLFQRLLDILRWNIG